MVSQCESDRLLKSLLNTIANCEKNCVLSHYTVELLQVLSCWKISRVSSVIYALFSIDCRQASPKISREKRRFLVVVASGGLNQQRNQIVDVVIIARVLDAALVVPVLQVNLIWGDER